MDKGRKVANLLKRKTSRKSPPDKKRMAKKSYRESEIIYKKLVESSLQGIVIAQGIPPRLVYANPAISRILGYSTDELTSLTFEQIQNLIHPDDRSSFFDRYEDRLGGKPILSNYEFRTIRKDGRTVWLELSATQIEYSGKPAVLATYVDITKRKRSEEALRRSEEQYRTILENIEDGYFEVDLAGNLTFFNDAVCRMLDYPRDELMRMNNRQYTDPENSKLLFQAFNKVYQTGIPIKGFEWEVTRKDGVKRYGDVSISLIKDRTGKPIGFRGIARDTTDRRKTEGALARSEERYRTLVEESFDGIFIQKGYEIIFANRRFHELLGYEEGELVGLDHWLVYHPDYQNLTRDRAQARLRGESPPSTYEVKFLRKDGSSFWGELHAKVINYLGKPGIQVWVRDITERRQVEGALIESKERLGMILDGINADIYIADMETHEILFMNKHMKDSFGDDLVGKICWQVFRGGDGPCPHCTNSLLLDSDGNPTPVKVWEGRNPTTNRYYLNYDRAIRWIDRRYVRLQVATDITDRKLAEEALGESREKFRFLAEKMADVVWTMDLNFYTTYVSPSIKKILGFTIEERMKQPLEQMVTPESLKKIQSLFREEVQRLVKMKDIDPDRFMIVEVEFYHKDGSTVWMENTIKAMIDPLGQWVGIYGVSRDITERKLTEETLRTERERFQSLSENAPFGMAMIAQDGVFQYINPKFKDLFGYDLNDIPDGRTWLRKAYPDSDYRHQVISAWLDDLQRSKSGEKRSRIFSVTCKDGKQKIINFIPVQLESGENLMTCEDFTELKRAEHALRESEERYRMAIESSIDGVAIVQNERPTYVNSQFLKMFGYKSMEEILIRPPYDWIHPNDREKVMGFNKKRLKGEYVPTRYETKGIRKDGEIVHLEISATKLSLYGEHTTLAYLRDITELKQAEEALRQTEEQLRHSQKIEAIGQLAGGIAHDFNNLLTVIKGYAELSCLGLDKNDPLRGNLEEIRKASERASNLTRQLLAFSRRQILELKVLNLNTILKDLDKMLHRILGEDIELSYHLSQGLGKIKTDPGQIEQVILNLAVNARDAMPSGGKLTIETLNVELDEAYAQSHLEVKPGLYVMLSVSDTGTGMDSKIRERIFEPFFTTKEKGRGTGLGLSTVYGIVKQSSGHINVYSEPGLGTTFKIYLPRVEEEEDLLQRETPVASASGGNETILLAEDEPSVRDLAARILRDRGYQVYEARNGSEALTIVQRYPEVTFHLLLTDVVMPGMSGKELSDRLKLTMPDLKVLFISGYTDNAIVHHGVLLEGVDFLQKPFTNETLTRKVRESLDR